MTRRLTPLARPIGILTALVLLFGPAMVSPPQVARAGDTSEEDILKSDFDELTEGTFDLDDPLDLEIGSVVAEEDTVTIEEVADDEALVVSEGGEALLRFSTYPDRLPQSANSRNFSLVLKAELYAEADDVEGATLSLTTLDGSDDFDFLTFGEDGELLWGDTGTYSITYEADEKVQLEIEFDLKDSLMWVKIDTEDDDLEIAGLPIPAGFTPRTVGQIRFEAGDDEARYAIDKIEVKAKWERDREPPKIVIVKPVPVIEVRNGVSLVFLSFVIRNDGGQARNTTITIELDDELLELLDLSFLEGIGYVKEKVKGKIVIALGENNIVTRTTIDFKLMFKVKGNGSSEVRTTIKYKVSYDGSNDGRGGDDDDDDDDDDDGRDDDDDDDDNGGGDDDDGGGDDDGGNGGSTTIVIVVPPVVIVTPPAPPVVVVIERLPITTIDIRFRVTWEARGGIRFVGFPLTQPMTMTNGIVVQYFERARFEYHPANEGTPYVVLLGLLGVELGYSQPPQPPPTSAEDLRWYFAPTGHVIAPAFRTYWEGQGGLMRFGYPIGVSFVDERGLLVQYFERTRLELHPQFAGTENEVLLGLLGEELLQRQQGQGRQ